MPFYKILFCTLFFLNFQTTYCEGQLSKAEKKLVQYIDSHNDEAIEFLKEVVNINSGTMNFEGVKQVGEAFIEKLKNLGMEVHWEDGSAFGRSGHVVAKIEGGKGKKILMIGHLDTVFEKDSPNQQWIPQNDHIVKGPGIADMKGGNVIILQTLSALHHAGLLRKMNITVVLTGDEEKSGRPLDLSKKALTDGAKWADIALGFENGDGNPATAIVARRSSSGWELKVSGHAAHSSQVFKPEVGAGAIFETSRILHEFYEQLSTEEFLTFNPGVVVGGTAITHNPDQNSGTAFGKNNVVSKDVIVAGDIRCISPEQIEKTQAKMKAIVSNHLPQTQATITFSDGYPPFALTDANYTLLRRYSKASTDLGYGKVQAADPINAGAADISFTSPFIEMGIDGLGLGGADDHTVNETGDLRTLPQQTKKATLLLYRLSRD